MTKRVVFCLKHGDDFVTIKTVSNSSMHLSKRCPSCAAEAKAAIEVVTKTFKYNNTHRFRTHRRCVQLPAVAVMPDWSYLK